MIHHPDYDAVSVTDAHRFPMRKYTLVAQLARQAGHMLQVPEPASFEALELVHDADYVAAIFDGSLEAKAARRIGFEITPEIAARSRAAVGGTCYAARFALSAGAAVNLAGGSHHADRDGGAGFCVFNDVAVAAEQLLARGDAKRILIVDLDVHHGDGTARIFAGREDVFTLSMHCEDNWPTDKPPSDIDVGLPRGAGDGVYLTTLRQVLRQAFDVAEPDFVFYNAGVDPHLEDRLGHLALSDGGLATRDRLVAEVCSERSTPICGVLGGGYSKDAEAVAQRHMFLVEALRGICVSA
jgi:acetoin utilization deacetylase AcuC-like enzyme